tara:strand:+ start:1794 stop:1970 length:177 start_codon:yes stop_codon:yes gene_type:complete
MKVFITEVIEDEQVLVGPYIKAHTMDDAIEIADMYNLTVIGEIHELVHNKKIKQETVH